MDRSILVLLLLRRYNKKGEHAHLPGRERVFTDKPHHWPRRNTPLIPVSSGF